MLTTPAIRSETRLSAVPDLIRETLLARLHFPAPRTGDLESMLVPPRTAGRNKGRTPLPSRRYRRCGAAEVKHYGPKSGTADSRRWISAPPALFAARIGPYPRAKNLVATVAGPWSNPTTTRISTAIFCASRNTTPGSPPESCSMNSAATTRTPIGELSSIRNRRRRNITPPTDPAGFPSRADEKVSPGRRRQPGGYTPRLPLTPQPPKPSIRRPSSLLWPSTAYP